MALENIIRGVKKYSILALASLSLSCGNCESPGNFSRFEDYRVCGNGIQDESCDQDNDGFCGKYDRFYFNPGETTICPETFKNCIREPELCPEK